MKWFSFGMFCLMMGIPAWSVETPPALQPDWLVEGIHQPVQIQPDSTPNELSITNGLIQRTFRLKPDLATVRLRNLRTEMEYVRGVKPEAQVVINGATYAIGGLLGQKDYAFLKPEWLEEMTASPDAFHLIGYTTGECRERLAWNRKRYSEDLPWPPKGKEIIFQFAPPENATALRGVQLFVHYEMYEGIPVLGKWVTIQNNTGNELVIDRLTTEFLAMVERESMVNLMRSTRPRPVPNYIDPNDVATMSHLRIHVQSDYAFCGFDSKSSDQTTFWEPDPQYHSQVNYDRKWPHLLTSRYPYGPGAHLAAGDTFESFRTFELLFDSDDDERRSLAVRRMYRVLSPWCTENPIMLHLRYSDSESIHQAVDQCAAVGFEMIILSFGSGVDMENSDPDYLARLKTDFDYAHSHGIEMGAYSLLSSRDVGPEYDVIDPDTGKPGAYFGNAPCLMSEWGDQYFQKIRHFIETTGCDLLEHDGSYPGDRCASTTHAGHHGLEDSQWTQHQRIVQFYEWCRAHGVYLNVPDNYILSGSNKVGMGYRESDWSLPRELQILITRQNIYDGTWMKIPSMGWMFVPLVEYQGGGEAATIEPLHEHLDTYEALLAENFGAGVQACYRGPRLYDTDETKAVVKKWVDFYKEYRDILDSDIIHLRRPDGRDLDGILHVNPQLRTRGFAMIYNPTDHAIEKTFTLPLYYTGIKETAHVREQASEPTDYALSRDYTIQVPVHLAAGGRTWLTIEGK